MIFIIVFFNDTAHTEIYTYCHTLSLHDALPIFLLVERAQRRRHLREVVELEAHVAGMAGGGGPEVGVLQRMGDGAVAAGGLAEHAAPPGAAAAEALLDQRHQIGRASCRERVCQYV